jgi:hypothetical protein
MGTKPGIVQAAILNRSKNGEGLITFDSHIKELLEEYHGVVYMYDFETYKTAIPIQLGSKPYEQVPYQYSIHVILDADDFD